MRRCICFWNRWVLVAVFSCIGYACQIARPAGAPLKPDRVRDGVYLGESRSGLNSAAVSVTFKEGRIQSIRILRQFASWKGEAVERIIPARIVEQQSTRVDAVSGATHSSVILMNAVQDAVEKARP